MRRFRVLLAGLSPEAVYRHALRERPQRVTDVAAADALTARARGG